jgi:PleD family two-component response regulator
VTASFGVTALGGRGDDLDRMIRRADAALYECKSAGRDRAIALAPPGPEPSMPSRVLP